MSGSPWLDWAGLAISLFNALLLTWLGLTVLLNAAPRSPGIWLAGGGLLSGAAFFIIHTILLGFGFEIFSHGVELWWRLGWIPVILAPLAWYAAMLWYTGYWEGQSSPVRRRHRSWLILLLCACLGMCSLFLIAQPLPSLLQITHLNLRAWPSLAGVPILILLYPPYILVCISLSLEALLRPGPTTRMMGNLARKRARPWLAAASSVLLLVSLFVSILIGWVVLSARQYTPLSSLARAAGWFDLAIETLIAASIVLTGQAIISYEVFTSRALPRRGLLRYWRRAVILAGGYSVLAALAYILELPPIYSLLLSAGVMISFFALLSWRSYAERTNFIDSLRPFLASQPLYQQLLAAPVSANAPEAKAPFRALCEQVLGASRASLQPLGPLAELFGPPLSYPGPDEAPIACLPEGLAQVGPETLVLSAPEEQEGQGAWIIPLWNGRGLCGALLFGEKQDGGLYTQEEMELARTAGERLVDYQVSAEIARRLMALQRQQLTESQVIDRRTRRALHDEILPGLHALLLDLTVQEANGAPSRAVISLSEIHRQIADLLSDLPGNLPEGRTTDLARLGLAKALQQVVEVELRQAFDQVSWQVSPEAARAAQDLPPLQAEVLFYAAREAVRNAARHARSTSSGIPLRLEASLEWVDGLKIQVKDNGIGIDSSNRANSAQPGGRGLALHSTLLAVIGGALSVQSEAGQYTYVSIYLPIRDEYKQP